MNYTADEVIQYIEEEDIQFIRLAFRDAFGVQKNVSIRPGEIRRAFEDGHPINAKAIRGYEGCRHASLYLKPDSSTMAVLPWRPESAGVLRMICDIYTPEGSEFPADTRAILKKAVSLAREEGIEFRFGNETEFYLFTKDDEGRPTKKPYDQAGYMDIAPLDRCENVRREISLTIERMGLIPERSHHERGPGQNEIDFHYGTPIKAADQMTTFKMAVSTVADRFGLVADFSPMPLQGQPGNGYHINIYAKDNDGNDVVQYAAAGILSKIREFTLFLNPSDDSYARFGKTTAPDRVNWSSAGESELMYIENYKGKKRVELRSPDASGNPYLTNALLIHAGLYGIRNRLELPGEMDPHGERLPASRKEAVELMKASSFVRDILPEDIIRVYAGE